MTCPRRKGESGFALLFVFAMAAIVAIMLYLEVPRAAFEAQRAKEDLLIQRGEQYQRAIKLFVRRFNRYPGTIEQLENTNNIRFLRRRYKDPMTGKDEWRFIHAVGGAFPDSLTQKGPAVKVAVDITQMNAGISGDSSSSSSGDAAPSQPASPAGWRRTRGGLRPGGVHLVNPSESDSGSQDPNYPPPEPTPEPDASGNQPDQSTAGGPVLPPGQLFPGQPLASGNQQPYSPQQPGQDVGGGMTATGGLANPSGLQPGAQAIPGNNPALAAIQAQLTGGSAGSSGSNIGIGAGIAGVASKSDGEGIKVYKDHTKYKEWEFIYDPRKDLTIPGASAVSAFPTMPSTPGAGAPGTVQPPASGTSQN